MLTNSPTDSTTLTLTLDISKLKDGVDTSSYCAIKHLHQSLIFYVLLLEL